MIIELNKSFVPNNPLGKSLISDLDFNGVSRHGELYLTDNPYYSSNPMTLEDLNKINAHNSMYITEYTFELIRKLCFSNMPSRFTSLFALESLDDLQHWDLLQGNFSIFEIEISEPVVKLDASFLKGGIALNFVKDFQFYEGFSPSINFYNAKKYWSGLFSEKPQPEVLISLPIKVGKEILL